jgi:hypothetical protein
MRVLGSLPLDTIAADPDGKRRLVVLVRGLMRWTVSANLPKQGRRSASHAPLEWNVFFTRWASRLSKQLTVDETRRELLTPIREAWGGAPRLTAEVLVGYARECLSSWDPPEPDCVALWTEACEGVLSSPELADWSDRDFLPNELGEAVAAVAFVDFGGCIFKPEWKHAPMFAGTFERWAEVIGKHPYAYTHLVTFLRGPGQHLGAGRMLALIRKCVEGAADSRALWDARENGSSTARLLQHLWGERQQEIERDPGLYGEYSGLVDRLVDAGIPLASVLQRQLEER